ncbi:hypothetical protein S101258_01569 [Lactiplantibacillus plantarum subsp. plantarum]|uniref:HTH tetR-type domain-containing protein n=1 Tax=Lactiplantibacillus plantarum subsp. plantarum TaxID=337330 RepID=A0A2S3U5T9_LACPN|nr:hypothetical protein S101258_01569 [Lactiplantibacillus plantarum subsp. plantarum]
MVGTKNNRRSQMTERLIQDSLINLLQHQSLDEITVTAVCKAADINRGTFTPIMKTSKIACRRWNRMPRKNC